MSKVSPLKTPITKVFKLPGSVFSGTDSFDPDIKRGRRSTRASSAPWINRPHHNGYEGKNINLSPYSTSTNGSNWYKNDFQESGGDYENHSVQDLEKYAVHQAEETTQKINGCLKVAEEIREVSSRTIVNLHQQGEQITKTHETATIIDCDLSRGEKLLGSLGGIFSKTWKPKKTRKIKGPVLSKDDSHMKRGNNMDQRQKLELDSKSQSNPRKFRSKPSSALERVEMEKLKQDDALSDLSNLLGELKAMAVDMGSEIDRQNKALDHMQDDVEELNVRVRGANLRTRRLLGR